MNEITRFNTENARCDRTEQIVSILYGESNDWETADFRAHLPHCPWCAAEMDGFESARVSLREWQTTEFANLATPIFELPTEKNKRGCSFDLPNANDETGVSLSWFDAVRAFFAQHSFATTATATALILTAGLFWLGSNSSRGDEHASATVARVDKKLSADNTKEAANAEALRDETPRGSSTQVSDNNIERQMAVNSRTSKNQTADFNSESVAARIKSEVKIGGNKTARAKAGKSDRTASSRAVEKPASKLSNKTNVPTLAIEDEEDNSLRLSDIFEEVSLR